MAEQAEDPYRCRLYLISPPSLASDDPAAFAEMLRQALDGGDVACFQLRLKQTTDEVIKRAANLLMPVCHAADVAFILNDRPDLARQLGADGVHVGQQDGSYADARRSVGDDAIVGVTCHNSRHLAMDAGEAGADYVAFGAFFPTATKEAPEMADIATIDWWSQMMLVPSVAIGGITLENCRPLLTARADFLAVVGGVWGHSDGPAAAVAGFNRLFDETAVI